MSQLSRPYQIALGAVLVLAVMWMLVLRPSGDAGEPAADAGAAVTAPGAEGLGNAVEQAEAAVAASEQSAQGAQAAGAPTPAPAAAAPAPVPSEPAPAPAAEPTPAPEPAAAPATPSAPAAPPADPSEAIVERLDSGRVGVVVFHESRGSDDRAVLRAVRSLARRGGKVFVHSIPIADVGRYGAITRGVQVLAAPTVLVIGPDRRARTITGLTDAGEIDELVDEVLAGVKAATATDAPPAPVPAA